MNRRDLFRSTLLGSGLLALRPGVQGQGVSPGQTAEARERPGEKAPDLGTPDWKPAFLDTHQNDTLIAVADRIIPAAGTPGAKAAQVNRIIDLVLSAEEPRKQRQFIEALSYLDGESQARYRQSFVALPSELQDELLEFLSLPRGSSRWDRGDTASEYVGNRHFDHLKGWISWAFYSSEAGMRSLGWKGSPPSGVFEGCSHVPGTHGKEL